MEFASRPRGTGCILADSLNPALVWGRPEVVRVRAQSIALTAAAAAVLCGFTVYQAPKHFNPMIDLHVAKKPVFGLYAPANPRSRGAGRMGAPGGGGVTPAGAPANAAPATPAVVKTPSQLVQDAFAYKPMDFVFDGSMEGDFDRAYDAFLPWINAVVEQGAVDKTGYAHLAHPIVVKTHKVAEDTMLAQARIAKQLNLGVSTIMFPETESAQEVRAGLAAMRFKSKGGTRPDNDLGIAPKLWGMSDAEYKAKADLWPLNPNGELTNWTIVESKEGLAHVREIAAVKGISVLWPGAGTLRGVFSTMDSTTKQRTFDAAGWENAIQQVLAACKEFNVPCGFPANDPATVEMRMKQGFTVFVANWGDNGFKMVEAGKQASGR
jgi:2-keto-3-deoxy-L-rhamnonate aldolase RhmA